MQLAYHENADMLCNNSLKLDRNRVIGIPVRDSQKINDQLFDRGEFQ